MLFSIIVPVYNVEKYLNTCVESLINQSYTDYEIILVDDGSKDSSGHMCDEYAKHDTKIKVVHQKNGGLSCARNTGIKEAKGEYLVFVDSDDWIDLNALNDLAKIITKTYPEVVETTIAEEHGDRTIIKDQHFSEYISNGFDKERALNWIICETEDTWPAWKRICKRSFILENDLFFAEGRLQEDIDWTFRLCHCAKEFQGYDHPWYHYRMKREGSIMNNIRAKLITDVIEMAAIDRELYDPNDVYSTKLFDDMMCAVYCNINLYKHCSKEDKKTVSACINQNRWIFHYTPLLKYKVFSMAVRIIGIDKALSLLSVFG